ncbi:MAG: hypothetical protein KAH04_01915, partial [Psychrilyobacter sp.]|nr:hypothetical protein [Psychrilyobacter sp.]
MIKVALNIVILFLMSTMVPLASFLLPVYKIKKMPKLNLKDRVVVNLIASIGIYLFDSKLFYVYIGFYLFIEGLYYIFERSSMDIFDRIFISTIGSTVIGYFLLINLVGTPTETMSLMEKIYSEYLKLDPTVLKKIMEYIKTNLLFIVFTYVLVINYFTYFLLKGKEYRKWKMSYLWIILFIATFFIWKVLKIDNFYIKNIYSISTLIYVIYGVKVLYSMVRARIKWKIYGKVLAIVTALFFPIAVFIL